MCYGYQYYQYSACVECVCMYVEPMLAGEGVKNCEFYTTCSLLLLSDGRYLLERRLCEREREREREGWEERKRREGEYPSSKYIPSPPCLSYRLIYPCVVDV